MANQSLNTLLKQFFADIRGVDPQSASFNDIVRLGLEDIGFTGSLNKMLKDWAKDVADEGASLNTAFRLALIDMGGTSKSINSLIGEVMDTGAVGTGLTWDIWGVKWDEEPRHWDALD